MLDESIYHCRGVWSILLLLFYFLMKSLLAHTVGPNQMPHYVASDLSLHCLPMTILRVHLSSRGVGSTLLLLFLDEKPVSKHCRLIRCHIMWYLI